MRRPLPLKKFKLQNLVTDQMGTFRDELLRDILLLSTDPVTKAHYSDIQIIKATGEKETTSKFLIFLMYPFLESSLKDADCIIIPEEDSIQGHLVQPLYYLEEEDERIDSSDLSRADISRQLLEPAFKENCNLKLQPCHICEFCSSNFQLESSLKKHIRERHTLSIKCPDCIAIFTNMSDLRKHQVRHGDGDAMECRVCGKKIKHKKNMQRHLSLHKV